MISECTVAVANVKLPNETAVAITFSPDIFLIYIKYISKEKLLNF